MNSHKTLKFLRGHKVEDLPSNELSPKRKAIHCSLHPDKVLELYCKTCQCVVCLLCFVDSHNGHNLSNVDTETRKEMQGQIEGLISDVETLVSEFEEDLKYINEIEQDKTKESTSLKEEINKSFDSLVDLAAIEARRAALVKGVEADSVTDLKEIWAQKELVETTITASKGALSLATRSLQCTNDLELLLLGAQLSKRLKELSEKNWDPTPIAEIEATSRQYIENTPFSIGKVQAFESEPSLFAVSFESTTFRLGVSINLSIKQNRRARGKKKLSKLPYVRVLHGRSEVDIPHPPTVMADHDKRSWSTTFTPVVSGDHVVVVEAKMNNGSTNKTESIITVTGEPSNGVKVQRGPDWGLFTDARYEDGSEGSDGSLISGETRTYEKYMFTIKWDKTNEVMSRFYRWGEESCYDLQLVL